ncbi:MAG: folate family ECF transporter S component [Lachnospiraceae bacterium]
MNYNFNKSQKLVSISLLIALEIILGRFFGIKTMIATINFSFLPLVINAILFGPVSAACSAAIADILGTFFFSNGMAYFPGFTVSAALTGMVYGLLFYRKPKKMWRIGLSCVFINLFISLGLSTYWVYLMTGKGFMAILPTRILQNVIMVPVKVFTISTFVYRLIPFLASDKAPKTVVD